MEPNSLDPYLRYPRGRCGTMQEPLAAIMHFKYTLQGKPKVRVLKPGKLAPYIMNASHAQQNALSFKRSEHVETPHFEEGSKTIPLPTGKYRHIASFSLVQLRKLGWDGATYTSTEGNHPATGMNVPFVCGYDSDPEHEYESFDVDAARIAGTVGIPRDQVGLYMDVAGAGLVRLKVPKAERRQPVRR